MGGHACCGEWAPACRLLPGRGGGRQGRGRAPLWGTYGPPASCPTPLTALFPGPPPRHSLDLINSYGCLTETRPLPQQAVFLEVQDLNLAAHCPGCPLGPIETLRQGPVATLASAPAGTGFSSLPLSTQQGLSDPITLLLLQLVADLSWWSLASAICRAHTPRLLASGPTPDILHISHSPVLPVPRPPSHPCPGPRPLSPAQQHVLGLGAEPSRMVCTTPKSPDVNRCAAQTSRPQMLPMMVTPSICPPRVPH